MVSAALVNRDIQLADPTALAQPQPFLPHPHQKIVMVRIMTMLVIVRVMRFVQEKIPWYLMPAMKNLVPVFHPVRLAMHV